MRKLLLSAVAIGFLSGVAGGLVACTSANPQVAPVVQAVATSVPVLNTAYSIGQLFCAYQGTVFGVIDAATKNAYSVIGKAGTTVANVCASIYPSAIPVVPPAVPTAAPAVAAIIPAAAK